MKYLEYKGYLGTVEPEPERGVLFGKLAFIRDLVTYEAGALPDLIAEFHTAVDMYLESCEALGHEPNKPFKGSFNVRVGPELHRAAALASGEESLNAFVSQAIQEKIDRMEMAV